ncbi:hypothetical protein ElyMa_002023500 [Elysia marginata]|uniref:Uncharacterized protein n=1 Tax=Elysia marginata TaxID=1093978 RepID=A0AAV4F761_9GAST|nr:hypothetical protein ElyMa_002023500 [Elysia marginata]
MDSNQSNIKPIIHTVKLKEIKRIVYNGKKYLTRKVNHIIKKEKTEEKEEEEEKKKKKKKKKKKEEKEEEKDNNNISKKNKKIEKVPRGGETAATTRQGERPQQDREAHAGATPKQPQCPLLKFYLHATGAAPDDTCDTCGLSPDDLAHMMTRCVAGDQHRDLLSDDPIDDLWTDPGG